MKSTLYKLFKIKASVIILFMADTVFSQDSLKYQTEEVVVTGTRTEKKIIDIPFSVERISKDRFKFNRSLSVDDVLNTVPGLFLQNRYGTHDVRISIRGFGSRSNTGIRGVRILQDGIPESEPDGQTRIETIDFSALGSIEVVKGNSSSLYTNAPGGVINFISDVNFPKSFVVSHNQFGDFDMRQNGLKIGITQNNWRLMMNYSYRNYKGYRAHSSEHQNIINAVAETFVGKSTTFGILLNSALGTIRLPGSISGQDFAVNPFMPNPTDVSRDTRRESRKGRLGIKFNTFFNDNNQFEFIGYGVIKDFIRTAATYRFFARYGVGGQFRFVNNVNISRDVSNEFSVGGDALYQTGPISEYENIGGQKSDLLVSLTDETISNTGVYFQDQISFMKGRLSFLLTGRYDKVVFDQQDLNFGVANAEKTYDRFTPKAGVLFKVTPHVALYTSYGLGFDTPAGNELGNYAFSTNPVLLINPDIKPQKSNNFEAGIKADLINAKRNFLPKLFTEVTFFNSMIEDEIVPFSISNDTYFRNAGKTNRTGVEFGINADVMTGLNFRTAYTFSDFKYDTYTARTVDEQTGDVTDRTFSGNAVPSVPKHLVSVDISYQRPLSKKLTGFIRANYNYVDKMYADDENNAPIGSYILLNGSAGLDLTVNNFNINLSGGVNNITDKLYTAFININADPGRSDIGRRRYYEAGAPRNFFASLNLGYTLQ